jgi:hypothetical protein
MTCTGRMICGSRFGGAGEAGEASSRCPPRRAGHRRGRRTEYDPPTPPRASASTHIDHASEDRWLHRVSLERYPRGRRHPPLPTTGECHRCRPRPSVPLRTRQTQQPRGVHRVYALCAACAPARSPGGPSGELPPSIVGDLEARTAARASARGFYRADQPGHDDESVGRARVSVRMRGDFNFAESLLLCLTVAFSIPALSRLYAVPPTRENAAPHAWSGFPGDAAATPTRCSDYQADAR